LGAVKILDNKTILLVTSFILILLISSVSVRKILWNESSQDYEYKTYAMQLLDDAHIEFEKIRGVSLREVELVVVNKEWVIENWGRGFADREIADILRQENIFKALFMIDQDISLYDARLEWTGRFRVAKWKGKIYVVRENFDLSNDFEVKSTFIHELTHIFQDRYSIQARKTFDGDKAKDALTEGDATFMAITFREEGDIPSVSSNVPDALVPMLNSFSDEIQLSLPPTIDDLNWFPYRYGVKFVEALYGIGGWEEVNKAFEYPPKTTEQILHPEKYLTKEDAHNVTAPYISGDWKLTKAERFGEYFILVKLNNWIPDKEAEDAAKGWGGDILSYYEKDDEYLLTWNITWDSNEDAHEFYRAFQKMMSETLAEKENDGYWSANERYISIEWNENSTLIVSSTNETIIRQPFFRLNK
jgi:hypothetical protein